MAKLEKINPAKEKKPGLVIGRKIMIVVDSSTEAKGNYTMGTLSHCPMSGHSYSSLRDKALKTRLELFIFLSFTLKNFSLLVKITHV